MSHRLLHSVSRFVLVALSLCTLLLWRPIATASQVKIYSLPHEVRSTHYRVRINGRNADVLHAATGYYLLNFDTNGPVTVSVTAEDPHFWDRGVVVQPMRLGIRPTRHGATLTFRLRGPEKLTISRPGDHFADADMLFLFANPHETPPKPSQDASLRYIGPGLHRGNINAKTGDRIYLDGGAVVLGSLNIWQVKDVRVFGRGTILYDGPQDPHADEGWMHKPNWHCIVMDNAQNIEIDGITCITRSRSWQIQMRDSRHIGFYNMKAIGGNPNDANQDGLDWLGGGDTTVRNSFFRASDDVFALQGNWEGYQTELLKIPGHDVTNITIEDTIASTSISNTLRVAWPQKTFNSAHFHMRDIDVIHTGFGGCKVPFAFFELWADPDGHGRHEDYTFRDIRLEDWYSLLQLRQPAPEVRNISFAEVWAMDGAAMLPPVMKGDVANVRLQQTSLQGYTSATVSVEEGAQAPEQTAAGSDTTFRYTSGILKPRQTITFSTPPVRPDTSFVWIFGDGSRAFGREVHHRFPDAEGTLLDGSGRYRVLLHATRKDGSQAWASQSIVLAQRASAIVPAGQALPSRRSQQPISSQDRTPGSRVNDLSFDVPTDGGYTFTLLTSTKGSLAIDKAAPIMTPKARPQVCGAPGNAVQPVRQSIVLQKGRHHAHVVRDDSLENADAGAAISKSLPIVLWEGPELERQPLPILNTEPSLPLQPSESVSPSHP